VLFRSSVRMLLPKGLYSKSFDEKFSTQIYYVASRHSPQNINRYKLKDKQNVLLPQSYSESELQKVIDREDSEYRVEKVLKRKRIGDIPHVLVKWFGYPRQFNSWIPASDVRDLS
jgi:hypothetical protein